MERQQGQQPEARGKQSPPGVSVIIPTFRRPRELEEAVRSALAQDVPVEVFVIDDSPERSAAETVARIGDARVRYSTMTPPTGGKPGLVRNHGLTLATAPVVHFLDDDDIVPRGHYRRALAAFAARPRLGAIFGRVEPFGSNEDSLAHERDFFDAAIRKGRRCRALGNRVGFAAAQSFLATMLVCSAGLVRRECAVAVGGFDGSLSPVEDVDFYARVFQRFEVEMLEEISIHYRIGPSLMHGREVQGEIDECYRHMHSRYRRELGAARFLALKILSRTLLRGS